MLTPCLGFSACSDCLRKSDSAASAISQSANCARRIPLDSNLAKMFDMKKARTSKVEISSDLIAVASDSSDSNVIRHDFGVSSTHKKRQVT